MNQSKRRMTKGVLASGVTSSILAFGSLARAEPETHDGFYLQMAAGLGYLSSTAEFAGTEATYSGITLPGALLLGGTVGPVVIGGGLVYDYSPSPSVEVGGVSGNLDDVSLTLLGIGVFADIYPDPHGGLHIQPFLGFGALSASYRGNSGNDATGLLVAIGAGHDWWVSSEWSIGVMGRLTYAPLSIEAGGQSVDYTTIAPSVLATFTFH